MGASLSLKLADYQHYLRRAPSAKRYHHQSPHLGTHYGLSSNAISNDTNYFNQKVHLKETLKTGKIHIHQTLSERPKDFFFFIDTSMSMQSLIERQHLQLLQDILTQWLKTHCLKGYVLTSQQSTDAHPWDQVVWASWLRSRKKWNGAVLTLISDFMGEIPSGPFWKCFAAHDSHILHIQHPFPEFAENSIIQDPDSHGEKIWNRDEFIQNHSRWQRELQKVLQKSQAKLSSIKEVHFSIILDKVFDYLTS